MKIVSLLKQVRAFLEKNFFDTYGVDFFYSLRIMITFQVEMLHGGMR